MVSRPPNPLICSAATIVLNATVVIVADLVAPYDPLATHYDTTIARRDAAHWLGTDAVGRDVLLVQHTRRPHGDAGRILKRAA